MTRLIEGVNGFTRILAGTAGSIIEGNRMANARLAGIFHFTLEGQIIIMDSIEQIELGHDDDKFASRSFYTDRFLHSSWRIRACNP
ncbi:hypothetical protein ABIC86_000694 [Paenibacillus sp. DS2363]